MTAALLAACLFVAATAPPPGLSNDDRKEIESGLTNLNDRIAPIRSNKADDSADAEVFAKGVAWALRYDTQFDPADVALLKKALDARQRTGRRRWRPANGRGPAEGQGRPRLPLRVDGSVQPYGVIVPAEYDPARPIRLDVVLHGSTQAGRHERAAVHEPLRRGRRRIEGRPGPGLHRACTRWAGSRTAIAGREKPTSSRPSRRSAAITPSTATASCCAACRWAPSGTWHLGLKHPDSLRRPGAVLRLRGHAPLLGDAAAEFREGRAAAAVPGEGAAHARLASTTRPTPASSRPSPAWARRTSSSRPTSSWARRWRKKASSWST